MFERLFSENGLSLDRLRALVEVGSSGSIVEAVEGDPVRQSLYSRQIKELEDFFNAKLVERQGKGIRLTASGKELARISRFFMMGLSNFRRGCLAEEQLYRIGASPTVLQVFLLPLLGGAALRRPGTRFIVEAAAEIERRLHDLTLDSGVVGNPVLSRPLQTRIWKQFRLELWVPRSLRVSQAKAARMFQERCLPLAVAAREAADLGGGLFRDYPAQLECDSFVSARVALAQQQMGALLPDFLAPDEKETAFYRLTVPELENLGAAYYLAWNPRLLRLNSQADRTRQALLYWLSKTLPRFNESP